MLSFVYIVASILIIPHIHCTLTVFWASHPTLPNETSIVEGWEFTTTSKVMINDKISQNTLYTNKSSLSFIIPNSLPLSIYSCQIIDTSMNTTSNTFYINKPEIWWVQGDEGDTASPGGWLRVFGKSLFFDQNQYISKLNKIKKDIKKYSKNNNYKQLQNALTDLYSLQEIIKATVNAPKLRLLDINNNNKIYELNGIIENSTLWHSQFMIPSNFAESTYIIEYSNGLKNYTIWSRLGMFIDMNNFNISTFTIKKPYTFPNKIFNIIDYNKSFEDTFYSKNNAGWYGWKWDIPLQRALNAARENNGGIVYFPRGKYYILGSIQIPNNTMLMGESAELVSLYFAEKGSQDALPNCYNESSTLKRYFCGDYSGSDDKMVKWGIKDFTFYISAYHSTVIEVRLYLVLFAYGVFFL